MSKRRVFNVDEAVLNNRPYVRLRGEDYPLADTTVAERVRRMMELFSDQEEIEKMAVAGGEDVAYEQLQPMVSKAVRQAFEGVPKEVADTVTELEFKGIQNAIAQARDTEIVVEEQRVDDPT